MHATMQRIWHRSTGGGGLTTGGQASGGIHEHHGVQHGIEHRVGAARPWITVPQVFVGLMQTFGTGSPSKIALLIQQLLHIQSGLVHGRLGSIPRLIHPRDTIRVIDYIVIRTPHTHFLMGDVMQ